MSEFVTIQVGQCGNQIGSSFWLQVLQEYGIQKYHDNNKNSTQDITKTDNNSFHSFFYQPKSKYSTSSINQTLQDLKENKVKARAVLIDMETSVISRFKNWHLNSLFEDKCFVSNYPGSGNNWAEGHCFHGAQYEEKILKTIQQTVERCESLHGFILLFSVGGGTGSGLGTFVLKLLKEHFPSIERFVICVYPTGTEDVITCPYNMALSTRELIENATVVFPVENRALLEIVKRQANDKHSVETMSFVAKCKPFQDLNSVIVNMMLHLTSGSRFSGTMNVDMNDIHTNMVPYPNLQFLSSGFSPLTVSTKKIFQRSNKQMKDDIFLSAWSRNNTLLKISPISPTSVLLGSSLIGRGDYCLSDLRSYVDRLQAKARFTDWSRKSVKIGLCATPPSGHSSAMLTLFNTTAMSDLFVNIDSQFMKLYRKRAHIHHYLQVSGFDENLFSECHTTIQDSINSYREIEGFKLPKIPRLKPTNL